MTDTNDAIQHPTHLESGKGELTPPKVRPIRARADAPIEEQMIQAGLSQGVPIADMKELYALRERAIADNARREFFAAMSAFRAEPIHITKNKTVSFKNTDGSKTEYDHAELSDVTEVVGPVMSKHGLSFRWNPRREGERVFVDTIVQHANGHTETVTLDGPLDSSGKKNAIQQLGSTITYLQRYGLMAILGVAAQGQDNDGHDDEPELTPEQIAENEKVKELEDKINLSEALTELQKLKPEIGTVKNADTRASLIGLYNRRFKALKPAGASHE